MPIHHSNFPPALGGSYDFLRRLVFTKDYLAVQNIDGHAFGTPR